MVPYHRCSKWHEALCAYRHADLDGRRLRHGQRALQGSRALLVWRFRSPWDLRFTRRCVSSIELIKGGGLRIAPFFLCMAPVSFAHPWQRYCAADICHDRRSSWLTRLFPVQYVRKAALKLSLKMKPLEVKSNKNAKNKKLPKLSKLILTCHNSHLDVEITLIFYRLLRFSGFCR